MPGKGVAVTLVSAGAVFFWSGVKGYSITGSLVDILRGKPPTSPGPQFNVASAGGSSSSGAASASAIVSDGRKYIGNRYVWGGTPGKTSGVNNGTDCSGFVNMVIGRDLGHVIPGLAHYDGSFHGPTTLQWIVWNGCKTIPHSQVQPGDLAVWQTHMGIFTDQGNMLLSALDTKSGVVETSLAGSTPGAELLVCRRLL